MAQELYICRNYLSLFLINYDSNTTKTIVYKRYFKNSFLIHYLEALKNKKKISYYYIVEANKYDHLYNQIKFDIKKNKFYLVKLIDYVKGKFFLHKSLLLDKKLLQENSNFFSKIYFTNIYDCGTHLNRIFLNRKLIFYEHGFASILSYLEDFIRYKNIYSGSLHDFINNIKPSFVLKIKATLQKFFDLIIYSLFAIFGVFYPNYTKYVMSLNYSVLKKNFKKKLFKELIFLKTKLYILDTNISLKTIYNLKKYNEPKKKNTYILIAEFTDFIMDGPNPYKLTKYLSEVLNKKNKIIFKRHPMHLITKKNNKFNDIVINDLIKKGFTVIENNYINSLPIEYLVKKIKIINIISDITTSIFTTIDYVQKNNICITFFEAQYPDDYLKLLSLLKKLFINKVNFVKI